MKQFPAIEFASTKIVKKGDAYAVTGDLSCKGAKKPVEAMATFVGRGETPFGFRAGFEATFEINRGDFGIDWNLGSGALGDDVKITVFVEGARK